MVLTARVVLLSLALLAGGSDSRSGAAPRRFEDFSVAVVPVRQPAAVRITDAQERLYASQLRRASHHAPDFAGHFVLASWGCGAGCVMAAAIDATTGAVTRLPFTVSDWPLEVTEPLEHKLNSSLLIVQGSRNEKGSGTYYYQFTGKSFVLLSESEAGAHK